MGAFDLLARGAAKGAKKVAPFFSKVDEVLDSLPRNKGTGDEFLREIEKTKGVKPAEIQDRGIAKALKNKPKMTKAEVQKIFESNPPPRVQEKVLSGEMPDYDEFIDKAAQERYGVDYYELRSDERAKIGKMYDELQTTQYEQYKTPGGENYREILLKLPKRGLTKTEQDELMLYEADLRRTGGQATPERMARYQELKAKEPENAQNYTSGHYKEDPNLLAHIRVQDFKTPEGKKVLLVDEIQSDWHQEGRKKGYRSQNFIEKHNKFNNFLNETKVKYQQQSPGLLTEDTLSKMDSDELIKYEELSDFVYFENQRLPDAPFKKNWHELAMKRVLDYAAENGYDTVAITPGVQQVKRYEDATRQAVDEVALYGDTLVGFKGGRRVIEQPISSPDELEQYIGKDMAQKLSSAPPDMNFIRSIKGEDLTVGGEGMKGFYDKILPDYLNNFGKQYGSSVGQIQLPTGSEMSRGASGTDMIPTYTPTMQGFHSFDITPQLRDEVKNKGLPLYSKTGMGPEGLAAGTGAATIGSEVFDANNEQQVQNPVHFTENPDAMLLELMQRN
jgi:hypothetical protein